MRRGDNLPSPEDAENLALAALGFLAEDPARLTRFLSLTGIGPQELRESAGAKTTLTAVLDFLMGDESLLLVFAAEKGLAPDTLALAQARLAGSLGRHASDD